MLIHLSLVLTATLTQAAPASRPASVIVVPLAAPNTASGEPEPLPKLTPAGDGVMFDLNADGVPERTAWTAADSQLAFLAIDRNGNGTIDSGQELFGNHTLPRVKHGVAALSEMNQSMGAPLKGRIFEGDPLYDKLLLWEDRNHNGVSEPDELQPAKNVMTVIGLGAEIHNRRDGHGNLMRYKGWAELRTGGPGQKKATEPWEHAARLRAIYEVIFLR